MNFEYSEKELLHSEILEKVAAECRSNKYGFKEGKTEKLDNIRELLMDSGYHEILLSNAQIWRRDFSSPIDVVVSSHSDIVDYITRPFSKLSDEGYYSGTYDNAGTNAAAVISMLEGNLPPNIAFAFTADEETGRCNGAKQVLEYVRNLGNEPVCIALDVTYEGYNDGLIFTVENLSSGYKKEEDMDFLNEVGKSALALENGEVRTCSFVKLHKNAVPEIFPKEYISKDSGWFDEGQAYAKEHARAFSLCLPCEGSMHGNSGVKVRQPEFEGYVNALEAISYYFARDDREYIETKRNENSLLSTVLVEMVKEEEKKKEEERASYKNNFTGVYNRHSLNLIRREMYEDDDIEIDYYSYNSSFGVYDDCLIGGDYSLSDFPSYDDYIGHIVDDIYDIAYEYELEDGEDALYLIEQIIDSTSSEVVEYFGGEDKYRKMLCDMIEAEFGVEIERTKQEDVKHDLRYDEDGYEYDESLIDMFLTPVEKVKYFIQIAEREEVVFTSEQKHLLMYYAKTIDDGDKAVEKARLLAHVIQTAPSLVSKEMNRINYEIDMYENDIYMSQNTEAETHYLPYEDFDDDYDDYD